MIKIYFHTNYPRDLTDALDSIHSLQLNREYQIERTQTVSSMDFDRSVLFLFDHSKKKIDLVTEAHYDSGYRVFAFRLSSAEKLDFFELGLTLIGLWSKILETIRKEETPFVFTYNYRGKALRKVR